MNDVIKETKNKIIFVTFADSKYTPSLKRIEREALDMGIFDNIYILCEKDFDADYSKFFYGQERQKMYAFGYYCWKSYAIKKVMDIASVGDTIVYCDAGCTLNKKAVDVLREWIYGMDETNDVTAFIQDYEERKYTKEEVFKHFNIKEDDPIRTAGQFFAGALILRKTASSEDLVNKWFKASNSEINLIDEKTTLTTYPDFVTPRYDQSILSILIKLYKNVNILSVDVLKSDGGIKNKPIIVTHSKKYSFTGFVKTFHKRAINSLCRKLGMKELFLFRR